MEVDVQNPLYFIHDFGSPLSAAEVDAAIRAQLGPQVPITPIPVTRFSTLEAGFCLGQLCRISGNLIFYVNVDPRTDPGSSSRADNHGADLLYFELYGGGQGLAPNAGYTLSFVRESLSALYPVRYAASGSPFRSRDDFPVVLRDLCNRSLFYRHGTGDLPAVDRQRPLESMRREVVPDLPTGIRVAHVDGSGNIKLTARASHCRDCDFGTVFQLSVKRGDTGELVTPEPLKAVYRPGDFSTEVAELSLVRGSSGPPDDPYLELFVRCRGPRDRGAAQRILGIVVEDVVEMQPLR